MILLEHDAKAPLAKAGVLGGRGLGRLPRPLGTDALAWPLEPAPGDVTDATLLHLADTIACAIAGIESEPGSIVQAVARQVPLAGGATVIGTGDRTTAELAAFANTVMVRTFDWNDGMLA